MHHGRTLSRERLQRIYEYLLLAAIILFALCLRVPLLGFESKDYSEYLLPWYSFIKMHGGFSALKYTFRQVLQHAGFAEIDVFDLNLYVFYSNPFNYVALVAAAALKLFFRACYILYGKNNRLFSKKIAGTAIRST
jgi:hypothetical protein